METPLEKARKKRQAMKEAGIAVNRTSHPEKLIKKPTSRKEKEICKCLDCANKQKSEITNCAVLSCPIWPTRPFRQSDPTDAEMLIWVKHMKELGE